MTLKTLAAILLFASSLFAQGQIDLTTNTKGKLPVSKGGTNATSLTGNRCVRTNAAGTALESAAADCGAGAGDIEGVTAGDGLTGGGTSGTVSLAVGVTAPITVAADAIALTQNAGTDITADLEEEAHVTEHAENGADELLGESLGTACAEDEILKANATGGLDCAEDESGVGGSGDAVEVEDSDNGGTFTGVDTTAQFEDSGDINFVHTDGGAGGPDQITGLVRANSVALSTDTTGNYVDEVTGGDGLTSTHTPGEGSEPDLDIDLLNSVDSTGATSTNSGMEFGGAGSDELALLQGCDDGEILKWVESSDTWNCSEDGGGVGGDSVDIQLFEVADTGTDWTLPTDGKVIYVKACGSGGGGGGGEGEAVSTARTGGGGGGGGLCAEAIFLAADITSPVTITVGAGGAGGAGGTSAAGTDGSTGNSSSFGSYLTVFGGGGGAGNGAGSGGGGGAGCHQVGTSVTTTTGGVGGDCFINGSSAGTSNISAQGAGGTSTTGTPAAGGSSMYGGAGGGASGSAGAAAGSAGGSSQYSAAAGGAGGGVTAANPGVAQNGGAGGNTGIGASGGVGTPGGGGAAGAAASNCGAGGEGQPGNAAIATQRPGGQGGGGGAAKNGGTGCNGGDGGYGGGGGGGGGGGTNVGGDGGDGGPGYVLIVTHF